jgi:hypothetical protein
MDIATLTRLFAEYQAYAEVAAFTFAAFRLGHIRGRRFVRKDRPRWYPHLPPLPVKPTNPLSLLLDGAAWAIMAFLAFGLSILVSRDGIVRFWEESAVLLLWMAVFGLAGYFWATGEHTQAVHRHRYATDPVYRADYDRRMAEEKLRREEEEWLIDKKWERTGCAAATSSYDYSYKI